MNIKYRQEIQRVPKPSRTPLRGAYVTLYRNVLNDLASEPHELLSLNRAIRTMGERIMPSKHKNKPQQKQYDRETYWINVAMNADQKKTFNGWLESPDIDPLELLAVELSYFRTFSIKWDTNNQCFTATLTDRSLIEDAQVCLVARSNDWYRALAACVFWSQVHFAEGGWTVDQRDDMI